MNKFRIALALSIVFVFISCQHNKRLVNEYLSQYDLHLRPDVLVDRRLGADLPKLRTIQKKVAEKYAKKGYTTNWYDFDKVHGKLQLIISKQKCKNCVPDRVPIAWRSSLLWDNYYFQIQYPYSESSVMKVVDNWYRSQN